MNILSLDPMYSPLHQMIMDEAEYGDRYTILSSLGLAVYFNNTKNIYFNKKLHEFEHKVTQDVIDIVRNIPNHYTNFQRKVNNCSLNNNELNYFASFYVYFESFVLSEGIDLVLLHNDLRWQHAIAVYLCKKHSIKYLVTEQGLFRPCTTIVDDYGVNAYSNVKTDFYNHRIFGESKSYNDIKSSHNSFLSHFNFLKYLLLSKIGLLLGYESLIVHKRHTISEYVLRFFKQKLSSSNDANYSNHFDKKIIFIPLQLETDTQLLIHSDFNNNQEVIDSISSSFFNSCFSNDYELVFKLHPNDNTKYNFNAEVKITKSTINSDFLKNVELVICVNSTAILNVLETDIPVITIGHSIYDVDDVAVFSTIDNLSSNIAKALRHEFSISKRREYVNYLKKEYSIHGAGYDYPIDEIRKILNKLKYKE